MKAALISLAGRILAPIATAGLLVGSPISARADGVAFYFVNGCSYTGVQGGSVTVTVGLIRVTSSTDMTWENHVTSPLTECLTIQGSGTHSLTSSDVGNNEYGVCNNSTITWPANYYSTENFTIPFNNSGTADWDHTGTVAVGGYVESGYCQTASLTMMNINQQAGVVVYSNGTNYNSGQIFENGTGGANATTIRFLRTTSFDARTIGCTVDGTAINNTDYTISPSLGSTATIASGANHVDFTITASPSSLTKTNRTMTVRVNAGTGYKLIANETNIAVTVLPDYTTNGVYATNWVMTQGESVDALVFYRNPTYASSGAKTISFSVGGTAQNGVDYTPQLTGSIVIPAGQGTFTNVLTPTSYTSLTGTKTVTVTLLSSNRYAIDPNASTATVGLLQDAPMVNVSAPSPSATLATPGQFTITRTGRTNMSLTIPLAIDGTGVAGTDYAALPGSITFGVNQTSTNLPVTMLSSISAAKTVLLGVSPNGTFYMGAFTNAVVTLLPNSSTTNSVASPAGRYWRGSGSDPTYWSIVVPLDYESGPAYDNLNGNCSALYPGLTSWASQTAYHYNETNTLPQTDVANRIAFNNPIVAFGERVGGTPLYLNENYSFGIYAGNAVRSQQPIMIQAYYRTNFQLAGTISILPPSTTNSSSWTGYATNGFQITTNGFGLSTTLASTPSLSWGATSSGAYILTHAANNQATNYYYIVQDYGYPDSQTDAMAIASNGQMAPSLFYSLEFEQRPQWRSVFIDQPHFDGSPLPPYYSGMTLAEMLTNTPPVTNAVSLTPSTCTNLDASPELRRHPILDQFVADMGNDPVALANYVLNEIDLSDAVDFNDNGNISEQSINEGGVSRGAAGVFLEKQGSPMEQCALLVYLLRQAGVPAAYVFPPHNGMMILDARLSRMLQFQVHGGFSDAGQLYTTNTMIPVNYPWVAAYIGTNWVNIFPWLKDYEITEGLDLYDYMPTNYSSAYPWVRDYIYGNTNLLSLAANGDNTPRVIFPNFLQQTLEQNYPGVSVDDLGVQILNRRHYYPRWQDFPTPTWVTNSSIAVESLTASAITNVSPSMTNIFDTLSVEIYSVVDPNKDIQTGDMRLADLHNRQFYITQSNPATNQITLSLILAPYRTNITTQASFGSSDPTLLSKQVLSFNMDQYDDSLNIRFKYNRHRTLSPAYPIDDTVSFYNILADRQIIFERPLRKGDIAAICMNYGRVTRDMVNVHSQDLWQMQSAVRANPSLTNTLSSDVYQGALVYACGMQYYKRTSDFNAVNQNLHKVHNISSWAAGLSKISPRRDAYGELANGGVDPILPNVDMFFYETVSAGNATLRPDSGQSIESGGQNYSLIEITDLSAEEHQAINDFYQQTNAVSTVRLLQLAQARGQGIVALNYFNYVTQGQTAYQGKQLQTFDPGIWQAVVSAFQNSSGGPYVTAYITPGPVTNAAYSGMGALVLTWAGWEALVSPYSLNGAIGENFANGSVAAPNTFNWTINASQDDISVNVQSPIFVGLTLAPDVVATYNTPYVVNQVLNNGYVIDPYDSMAAANASAILGISAQQNPNQLWANVLQTSEQQGNLGGQDDAGSSFWTKVMDPVHTVTGEFYVDDTDLQVPGPIPLALRRNYSSQNIADNQFGPGWKLSIMPYLSVSQGSTNIYAADMDGAVLAYVRTATNANVWLPTLAANPQLNNNSTAGVGGLANRLRDSIVMSVNGPTTNYTLFGADGSVRAFQVMTFNNGVLNQTRPYLLQWTDNLGNYYIFAYGTDMTQADFGQVRRIQCSNGNYLGLYYDIYGHIIEAYVGDGRRTKYDYDEFGDLTTVTLADASTRSYVYQHGTQSVTNGSVVTQQPYSTHLIIEEDKPDGRELLNIYDSQRRVTNQLSTAGADLVPVRTATFIYSNNFNITNSSTNAVTGYTQIIDGNNHTNRFDYVNSLITQITDPLGQTIQQVWYPDSAAAPGYPRSLASRTDKRGLVTQFQYDFNGNVTNSVLTGDLTGDGIPTQTATHTAVYNTNSLPLQITDPAGNSLVYVYDPTFTFLPQQVIRYAGAAAVSTNLQLYGSVTNVVTLGAVTQTNVAVGVLTRQIRAYGSADAATNDFAYDAHGFPTQSVRYTGTADPAVTNTFFYNERGELVDQVDALGAVTHSEYDALDRLTARENFDESGNLLAWNFNYYNDNGELVWTDGPRYNPEDYVWRDYDGAGRLTTEIHWRSEAKSDGTGVQAPAGYNLYAQTFNFYDVLGNLTYSVDPRGAITTNTWDALGRLTQRSHLDLDGVTVLSTETFGYEPGDQVRFYTNAIGGYTDTEYTTVGKPEFRLNADGSTNGWRYYLDGRIRREFQRNGDYTETTYDDLNRIATRIFYSAAGVPLSTNSTQQDRRGNVIVRVDEAGNVFTNLFDGLDRQKISAGPPIQVVTATGFDPDNPVYVTNIMQHAVTNVYDAANRVTTSINALGEQTVTYRDALGRVTGTQIFNPTGTLVRQSNTAYSPDHNSVTITNGSGASAVASTTFTDNDGHTVLSVAYPATGVSDYTLSRFDLSGNLTYQEHDSSSNGLATTWTTAACTYDGLNRPTTKTDRDSALTRYFYDPAGDQVGRTMPGGLQWSANYNSAGQMLGDWLTGTDGSVTRSNSYTYYPAGSPTAGLIQTRVNGVGFVCTYTYDDWLRTSNTISTTSYPNESTLTIWNYDSRGFATNILEEETDLGTSWNPKVISRTYDAYGQMLSESVSLNGVGLSTANMSWDGAGRRTVLDFGAFSYMFAWRPDGLLASVSSLAGGASYSYDTAGILTDRMVGSRWTTVGSRDGEARPLTITTKVNLSPVLTENMSWTGDGLLNSHTLARSDFTDARSYLYGPAHRRLTQELLNLSGSSRWTNNFVYDNGMASGPGALTMSGSPNPASGDWTGGADVFSRVNSETNTSILRTAYGRINGAANVNAVLDNQPVPISINANTDPLWTNRWQTDMELLPGPHRLAVYATLPSGFFTTNANVWFTNISSGETVVDSYSGRGVLSKRVWHNWYGLPVERQQFIYRDSKDRVIQVLEYDSQNNGYSWFADFDALGRRLQSRWYVMTNGVAYYAGVTPTTITSFYDPLVEFLELGVEVNGDTTWKICGPDLNGQYGGMNGTGGFDAAAAADVNQFYPVINDFRGNVLGSVSNAIVAWNPARPTGYGGVPTYRPVPFGHGASLVQSSAWRGRWTDISGFVWLGARTYDPVSGRFMESDPVWNGRDPNYYSFAGGDPINGFDPDGRCFEAVGNAVTTGIQNTYNVLYTGELHPSPEVYDAAVNAAGDYVYDSGGVRGFYGGVGVNSKYPGVGSLAGQGGLTGTWTVDTGAGAEIDAGVGLQERGQNSLGIFTSQTVGVGSSYQFWSQGSGFQAPSLGSSGNISAPSIYGGTANSQGGANFIIQNQNNAGIGINYGPVYGGLIINPSLVLQNFVDSYHIITGTH